MSEWSVLSRVTVENALSDSTSQSERRQKMQKGKPNKEKRTIIEQNDIFRVSVDSIFIHTIKKKNRYYQCLILFDLS